MMQLLALVSQTVFYGSEGAAGVAGAVVGRGGGCGWGGGGGGWGGGGGGGGGGGLGGGGGAEGEQLPTKELLVHVMFC